MQLAKFGNTIPRELVQSNQLVAYEEEDPQLKFEQFDSISDVWEKVLENLAEGDLQQAYVSCVIAFFLDWMMTSI